MKLLRALLIAIAAFLFFGLMTLAVTDWFRNPMP